MIGINMLCEGGLHRHCDGATYERGIAERCRCTCHTTGDQPGRDTRPSVRDDADL